MTIGKTAKHESTPTQAIEKVLEYLEDAEARDYEAIEEEEKAGHIYESVQILRNLLDPEEAVTSEEVEAFKTLKVERQTAEAARSLSLARPFPRLALSRPSPVMTF